MQQIIDSYECDESENDTVSYKWNRDIDEEFVGRWKVPGCLVEVAPG